MTTTADTSFPTIRVRRVHLDRRAIATVAGIFLLTHLVLYTVLYLSSVNLSQGKRSNPDLSIVPYTISGWDGAWYQGIAKHGYSIDGLDDGKQTNVAFFPLYPLLIKLVSAPFGWDTEISGLLISNLSFLGALGFLYAIAARLADRATATRAVWFLSIAPTAIFFTAVYSESLFLFAVLGTFFFCLRRQWLIAGLFGAIAAATRNTGVLMAFVIVLSALAAEGWRLLPTGRSSGALRAWAMSFRRAMCRAWPAFFSALLPVAGLLAYAWYLGVTFGRPLAFLTAQRAWGRSISLTAPLALIPNTVQNLQLGQNFLAGHFNAVAMQEILATLAFLPLVIVVARRFPPAFGFYTLASFGIPLASGTLTSINRYALVLFPCYIVLAIWARNIWVERAILLVSLPLVTYFAVMFSNGRFAG